MLLCRDIATLISLDGLPERFSPSMVDVKLISNTRIHRHDVRVGGLRPVMQHRRAECGNGPRARVNFFVQKVRNDIKSQCEDGALL